MTQTYGSLQTADARAALKSRYERDALRYAETLVGDCDAAKLLTERAFQRIFERYANRDCPDDCRFQLYSEIGIAYAAFDWRDVERSPDEPPASAVIAVPTEARADEPPPSEQADAPSPCLQPVYDVNTTELWEPAASPDACRAYAFEPVEEEAEPEDEPPARSIFHTILNTVLLLLNVSAAVYLLLQTGWFAHLF